MSQGLAYNTPYKNIVISTGNSGAYSTASGSYVTPTNMSVTITTLGGAVQLKLQSGDPTQICYIAPPAGQGIIWGFFRGATQIAQEEINCAAAATAFQLSGCAFTDTPPAGTYTYTFQMYTSAGTALLNYAQMVAQEI